MQNAQISAGVEEQRSFDLLPLGLCVIDRQMVVHCWNRLLEEWTGIGRRQIIGRSYSTAVGTAAAAALHDRVAAALEGDGLSQSACPLLETLATAPHAVGSAPTRMKQRITVRRWDDRGELALLIFEDVTA